MDTKRVILDLGMSGDCRHGFMTQVCGACKENDLQTLLRRCRIRQARIEFHLLSHTNTNAQEFQKLNDLVDEIRILLIEDIELASETSPL